MGRRTAGKGFRRAGKGQLIQGETNMIGSTQAVIQRAQSRH